MYVLIVDVVSQKQVVIQSCEAAQAAGVRPGMSLADARALLPAHRREHASVIVHPHRPQRDLAALRSLAQWALRVSPIVALDPPDGLLLDMSGCDRIFRSEERLLRRLALSLARFGLTSRAAIAPTFACARAVARFGADPLTVIPDSGARAALERLPVAALNVAPEVVDAFHEVGVTTIGEVLRLPRSHLPSRFGDQLLLQLDRALGQAVEIIHPVQPIIPLRVERLFDGPTTHLESIELAARELLADLAAHLNAAQCGVSRLNVVLDRIGTDPVRFTITLGRPSLNVKHLWTLLRPRIVDANLGFGVERIEFTAARTGRLRHTQTSCWVAPTQSRDEIDKAFWEFADAIIARLGPHAILQPRVRSTHLPERVFEWSPLVESADRPLPACADGPSLVRHRPSLLLDIPEPIDAIALTPDGPVSRLTLHGVTHTVIQCAGPERFSPEWWRRGVHDAQGACVSHATRDYFRVTTDTARSLWVFKELETSRWYLHGEWT